MNDGSEPILQDEAEVHLLVASQEEDSFTVSTMPTALPSYLAEIDDSTTGGDFNLTERSPAKESIPHKRRLCCHQPITLVFGAAALSALGGVLFGYDIGIVSGALLQLRSDFCLSCPEREAVVSTMLGGAVLASLTGGFLVDYFGRRITIIVNCNIFIMGAVILTAATSFAVLIVGRVIVGYAVALSVIAECVYMSEISPHKRRGMLVSLNELGIVLGFLLAYVVNYAFIQMEHGWRYMFGLSIIPAVIQGLGMCFLPSSPRFLISKNKEEEAREVLQILHGNGNVDEELDNIKAALKEEKSHSVMDLFKSQDNLRYRMFIGVGLVFLQQFTGQPNVLYYAPTIFQTIGFHSDTAATLAAVGLGFTKVVFCTLALCFLDRTGRRKLLMTGVFCMALSITVLGLATLPIPSTEFTNPCSLSNISSNCNNQPVEGDQINSKSTGRQRRHFYNVHYVDKYDLFTDNRNHQDLASDVENRESLNTLEHQLYSGQTAMNTLTEEETNLRDGTDLYGTSKSSADFVLTNTDANRMYWKQVFKRDIAEVVNAKKSEPALGHNTSEATKEANSTSSPTTHTKVNTFAKWSALVALVGFVGSYEIGFGTGTWLVLAEIFPSAVRGRAIGIATVFNWGTNLLISSTFLDIIGTVGISWTFLPYGIISALAGLFIYVFVPETKGKTLEQIGQDFQEWSCLSQVPCCRKSPNENSYRIMDMDEISTDFNDE